MATEEIAIIVFTLGFLLYWVLWLGKLYNVMSRAKAFSIQVIILSFLGIVLSFGFSIITMLAYPSSLLSTLILSEAFTLPAALIFFVVECILNLGEIKMMFKTVTYDLFGK